MTPFTSTLLISAIMLALGLLPLHIHAIRSRSRFLFLAGTGALVGLLAFDLVPDVIALGGRQSLVWIGLVWALYSLFHLTHVHHHRHRDDGTGQNRTGGVGIFLFALSAHCFSSGMLLAVADGFTVAFQRAVFIALLAHKAYEALTVSTIVAERVPHKTRAFALLLVYASSLPLGEAFATYYRSAITPQLALVVTCIATGSLLGCLYSDFLLPSLHYLRARKMDIAWVLGGLVLTEVMIRAL